MCPDIEMTKTLHLEGSFILCIKRLGYSEAMAHRRSCSDKRGPGSRHPHLLSAGTIWMVEELGTFHSEIQNIEALRAAGKYMSKHKATVSSHRFPCILNTFYLLLDRSELTSTALNLPLANDFLPTLTSHHMHSPSSVYSTPSRQ